MKLLISQKDIYIYIYVYLGTLSSFANENEGDFGRSLPSKLPLRVTSLQSPSCMYVCIRQIIIHAYIIYINLYIT